MAAERVGTHEAKTHLSEHINRVRYLGERIVIGRHGKPDAALVSTKNLARLESPSGRSAEELYREALEESGLVLPRRKPGRRVAKQERRLSEPTIACSSRPRSSSPSSGPRGGSIP